ncbi:hypothetical protein [Sangeribacter muris]|uniref:hypothetical protein n=1 Tax=Sangeribacter muris TaxID=2880703 RepID=UPI00244DF795|nr:hypothetical protein [Sangeribacter muris]
MEKQIYELMAQAEILQEHALEIQNGAVNAISGIPEAVDEATEKIRSTALMTALIFLLFGLLTIGAILFGLTWSTDGLKAEKQSLQQQIEDLKKDVQAEKKSLAEIKSQNWGMNFYEHNGHRYIKLKKGDIPILKELNWDDGSKGIEITSQKN